MEIKRKEGNRGRERGNRGIGKEGKKGKRGRGKEGKRGLGVESSNMPDM